MQISRRRGRASIIGLGLACAYIALAPPGSAQQTVPLDNGISPHICLYATHKNLTLPGVWNATLLASRFFTVPAPPPQGPAPATVVTLSRATALSKARSALKKRFGKAYKRGKRKRLSCAKRSSTRHRCTYSFRYRQKRQKGTVTVAIKPDGSFMTKIKRR